MPLLYWSVLHPGDQQVVVESWLMICLGFECSSSCMGAPTKCVYKSDNFFGRLKNDQPVFFTRAPSHTQTAQPDSLTIPIYTTIPFHLPAYPWQKRKVAIPHNILPRFP